MLAGEQQVLGVELGASGEITDQWSIFAGVAFMNGDRRSPARPSEIGAQLAVCAEDERELLDDVSVPPAN